MLSVDESFVSFFCYFDLLPLLLFVPIGLTWDTQCNITAFKLLEGKKWWYFEHRVIACRSDKVLVSIVCNDLAFLSNLAGCFSHWDRVRSFFFCLFSVSVWIFPISMHWKGDTTKHIQRELNLVIVRAFDVSRLQGLTNLKNIISSQAFRLFNIICLSLNHISSRRSYDFLFFLIYQQNIQLHDLRRLKVTVILSPKVKSIVYIMNAFTHNESDIILQDLHAFAAASNSLCAVFFICLHLFWDI